MLTVRYDRRRIAVDILDILPVAAGKGRTKMNMRLAAIGFLALVLAICVAPASPADTENFAGLQELQGLLDSGKPVWAYFDSVSEGKLWDAAAVRRYQGVEIRGIANWSGLQVIIFKTKHHIVAGMSGSPVYLMNGKKIGALAYRNNDFPPPGGFWWGGISPIELMQEESSRINAPPLSGTLPTSFVWENHAFADIPFGTETLPASVLDLLRAAQIDSGTIAAFAGMKLVSSVRAAGEGPKRIPVAHHLIAGMPISVDLLELTDENGTTTTWSGVGTITHIDSQKHIYAFGHPFLDAGNAKYFFRTCAILGTAYSESYSYKVSGKSSEVLGAIKFDGRYGIYGIYGETASDGMSGLTLHLKRDGASPKTFTLSVADCAYTSLLMQIGLEIAGELYGTPRDTEAVMTELESDVTIKGYTPLSARRTFSPSAGSFGPFVFRRSSYGNAINYFCESIYVPLFVMNNYGFRAEHIELTANFIQGTGNKLTLVSCVFPETVTLGEKPILELIFVNRDNTALLTKRIAMQPDWSRIAKLFPEIKKNSDKKSGSDKMGEAKTGQKPLDCRLFVLGPDQLRFYLSEEQREEIYPSFFLEAKDYLAFFEKSFARTNQVFVVITCDANTGDSVFPPEPAKSATGPGGAPDDPWEIKPEGLKERIKPPVSQKSVSVLITLPPIPGQYVIDPGLVKVKPFTVFREARKDVPDTVKPAPAKK